MSQPNSDFVWWGIEQANPWWRTGAVPRQRTEAYRRHAFGDVYDALRSADPGRGVVLLGPRRVGKSVLLHQIVERLFEDGVPRADVVFLSLDDVALRQQDLGALLDQVAQRMPADRVRYLLLDEVQHAPQWSGWLKRLADRRDPWRFLATGSSATALAHGTQDAGFGRWREMVLYPWSFREHVQLTRPEEPELQAIDQLLLARRPGRWVLRIDEAQAERLDAALIDYLLRGGFPEATLAPDLVETRRRLRQDILDRALGRDISDTLSVDPRLLERLFLRVTMAPGGLWNTSEVSQELGVSRPVVSRYLSALEAAFLVFRLPNLASPMQGQPKVYLTSPSLRPALLGLEERHLDVPEEWGRLAENAVVAALMGTRPNASRIGFWRRGNHECDAVVDDPSGEMEFIEVKRTPTRDATRGIARAWEGVQQAKAGWVLGRRVATSVEGGIVRASVAAWLYGQDAASGGTLRNRP